VNYILYLKGMPKQRRTFHKQITTMSKKNRIAFLHFAAVCIALIGYCFLDDIAVLGIGLIAISLVLVLFIEKKYVNIGEKDKLTLMDVIAVMVVSFGVICFANEVGVGKDIHWVMIFPVMFLFVFARKASELIYTGTFKDYCVGKKIVIPRILFVIWTALLMIATSIYVITQRDGIWAYVFFCITFFMVIAMLWILIAAIYCNSVLYRELRIGYIPDLILYSAWVSSRDFLDYFPTAIHVLLLSVLVLDALCCKLEENVKLNDYGTHNFDD